MAKFHLGPWVFGWLCGNVVKGWSVVVGGLSLRERAWLARDAIIAYHQLRCSFFDGGSLHEPRPVVDGTTGKPDASLGGRLHVGAVRDARGRDCPAQPLVARLGRLRLFCPYPSRYLVSSVSASGKRARARVLVRRACAACVCVRACVRV